MSKKKTKLSLKERNFCCNYVNTGNVKESALKAGYINAPEKIGSNLLAQENILQEIKNLYQQRKKNLSYRACSGYERLAFGSIADSIQLLFTEDIKTVCLEKMDLFNISEIRILKGGGMEIKFFDRLKALEKLQQVDLIDSNETLPFYKALEQGAKVLEETEAQVFDE